MWVAQLSVKVFEANLSQFLQEKLVSNYNAVFEYMVQENFLTLTDFTVLMTRSSGVTGLQSRRVTI